jgi:xylan 1,4-beta-xylosidase
MKKILTVISILLLFNHAKSQTLSVDFSTTDTTSNMIGFLHAMDATNPHDSLIVPLQPGYWRAGGLTSTIYTRATTTIGAQFMIAVSDFYGYPPGWTPPYSDTTGFKTFVDNLCASTASIPVIYDIWNEPNGTYWAGTQLEFFQTFKMAHDRIRFNLGSSVPVCGPSIVNADTTYIRAFCNYCVANNVQLDVLSFHWFYNDSIMPYFDDVLLWCRTNFIDDPAYASLQIQKIVINEVVNESGQYKPAFNLAHFYYLEKGKANGSCKACWNANDSSGTETCFNNTLNGILTPTTNLKRGVYWAYRRYAELDSIRYLTTSSNSRIFSITGNLDSDSNSIRMMIGYYHNTVPLSPVTVNVTLNNLNSLAAFPSSDSIRIKLYKIPNTEFSPLAQPIYLGQYTYANNTSSIALAPLPLDTNAVVYADIVSTSATLGSTDLNTHENKFSIYPNPTQQSLTVSLPGQSFNFSIYDCLGREVVANTSAFDHLTINCEELADGIYFIRSTSAGKTYVEKFTKNQMR